MLLYGHASYAAWLRRHGGVMTVTTEDLVKKYVAIRDYLKAEAEKREAADKPYIAAMDAIEGALSLELDRLGADSIKTGEGTAYRSTIMSPRMVDREVFMSFLRNMIIDGDPYDRKAFDFITSAISKDAVKAHMEENGAPPPGVDLTYIKRLNIRRS